jgi:hypothetical protein
MLSFSPVEFCEKRGKTVHRVTLEIRVYQTDHRGSKALQPRREIGIPIEPSPAATSERPCGIPTGAIDLLTCISLAMVAMVSGPNWVHKEESM